MKERLEVPALGARLRDWLFEKGVEFPCGGLAGCGACRIRVLRGEVPITAEMRGSLSEVELAEGWRLACQAEAASPLLVEIEQWSAAPVLSDHSKVAYESRHGFGAAIDLGTTTVVVQVVDLESGEIAAVETAWNAQARYGADIMSRLDCARREPGLLTEVIRRQLESMLSRARAGRELREILLVGNTAMHHLCGGLDVAPLCAAPFRSPHLNSYEFKLDGAPALFLGSIGGFAGSDLLAGLIACDLPNATWPQALLDLGTNGEIAFGCRDGIEVASTAAGPAFEAGRITQGMRAAAGAIDQVRAVNGRMRCRVIGGGTPRGVCGSGLVDAVAAALELGWIAPSGRMLRPTRLTEGVSLLQRDIRELQLAKAAVASGFRLLSQGQPAQAVYLSGAFGNYIRASSAVRIGLLPGGGGPISPAGNTALRGARKLLLNPSQRRSIFECLRREIRHVELAALPEFHDAFVDEMEFPD